MTQNKNNSSAPPFAMNGGGKQPMARSWLFRAPPNPLHQQQFRATTATPATSTYEGGASHAPLRPSSIPHFGSQTFFQTFPSSQEHQSLPLSLPLPPPHQAPADRWATQVTGSQQLSQPSSFAVPWTQGDQDLVADSTIKVEGNGNARTQLQQQEGVPISQPSQTAAKLLNELTARSMGATTVDINVQSLGQKVDELQKKQDDMNGLLSEMVDLSKTTQSRDAFNAKQTQILELLEVLAARSGAMEEKLLEISSNTHVVTVTADMATQTTPLKKIQHSAASSYVPVPPPPTAVPAAVLVPAGDGNVYQQQQQSPVLHPKTKRAKLSSTPTTHTTAALSNGNKLRIMEGEALHFQGFGTATKPRSAGLRQSGPMPSSLPSPAAGTMNNNNNNNAKPGIKRKNEVSSDVFRNVTKESVEDGEEEEEEEEEEDVVMQQVQRRLRRHNRRTRSQHLPR